MVSGTRRTLIVTNDFPPRQGGIQSFVHALALRQPADSVVVLASEHPGWEKFDAAQPFPVERHRVRVLLPTAAVRRHAVELAREHDCAAVWFGAAAPLGLLGSALHEAGIERVVATTHGHEVGWAMLPGARALLRRIGQRSDVVTYLGEYTRSRLTSVLGPAATLRRLTPGVDTAAFHAGIDGTPIRARHGIEGRQVVVCVSRLVPRKGQDTLIRALPSVRRSVPDTVLLLVGHGSYRAALERLATRLGVRDQVIFAGSVSDDELPAHYAAGDVFAMPCRTRRGGLDVEGLGIVYLEASAIGLPVIAGDSGGAPDAVRDGETGYVVPGRDVGRLAGRLTDLLSDAALRQRMGETGRAWVEAEWTWEASAAHLRELLDG